MDLTAKIICLVIGYAAGCFQTAYLVGRKMGNIDIREHGSGNAGSTNVLRVMGKKAGLITFAGDLLKAVITCLFCAYLFGGIGFLFIEFNGALTNMLAPKGSAGVLPVLYGGLGVVLGHNFPFTLSFKGGKGVASTIGIILCADLRISLILILVGFAIVYGTRIVSITSLTVIFLFFALSLLFRFPWEASALCGTLFFLAVVRHKDNIVRLINGTESKLGSKKSGN